MNEYPRTGELAAIVQARFAKADAERSALLDQRIRELKCRYCGRYAQTVHPIPGVCAAINCQRRHRIDNGMRRP